MFRGRLCFVKSVCPCVIQAKPHQEVQRGLYSTPWYEAVLEVFHSYEAGPMRVNIEALKEAPSAFCSSLRFMGLVHGGLISVIGA